MSEIYYKNMYTPIKVGNVLLKSRYFAPQSKPHSLQGPETYPAEGFFRHFINKAKNGAAYVTMGGGMALDPPVHVRGLAKGSMLGHFPGIDVKDSTVQNYLCQLADAMHFYDAKASMMVGRNTMPGWDNVDASDNVPPFIVLGDGGGAGFVGKPGRAITEKEMNELIEETALECAILQECGFDMVYLHAAYRLEVVGRMLSKRTNFRTDEYGGSMENRARFLFNTCDRIKERCGKDFPIEVAFTAIDLEDPDPEKHWTLDDTREFVELAKGHIDILQVRPHSVEYVHNMGFEPPLPTAEAARAAHEAAKGEILISGVSGYCHPDLAEKALDPENGYLDLVGMGRLFISNPEIGSIIKEGRGEDVVPCVKCNKCHRNSYSQSHMAVCSVNPTYGREHRIDYLNNPVKEKKNIAIVGGGPAGMRAAMYATENGHRVTLFEKSNVLGGQLKANEFCSFKWPVWNYTTWLRDKVLTNPKIDVRLNTEATPEILKMGNYDEIFAAIGADPVTPKIPGIENAHYAADIWGRWEQTGKDVVIIGGGEIGVETGFQLAYKDRNVFVIEMREELMLDATPIHYRVRYMDEWNKLDNFNFACSATCTKIGKDSVTYTDKDGEHTIHADTVIYSVGTRAKEADALKLFWPGKEIHLIGDCKRSGSIQSCNRDAYDVVNSL